ncbi:MAG: phosphoribosylformylglycinamidine cyclo-ligase [Bradymonadaceae bacterium]
MTDSNKKTASRYQDAGVDLDAGQEAVKRYKSLAQRTFIPGVLTGLGGFGALFGLREAGVDLGPDADPILVSGTDGVGTKLKIAMALDRHDTIGIDCVAMCVNDVLTTGARPLFFLDYLATGKLLPDQAEAIVRGIAEGCAQAGCALIGGETAEMPGFYKAGEYDIAGFCVGVVDRKAVLDPSSVQAGDTLIGIASSGIHSNGYSLVRKIVDDAGLSLNDVFDEVDSERTLGDVLLEPTRIYAGATKTLLQGNAVVGLSHITGGGFHENLPRILPDGLGAEIEAGTWPIPPIFRFLQRRGDVSDEEMFHVFNMGIGLVAAFRGGPEGAIESLEGAGYEAWPIGKIVDGQGVNIKE